MWCWDQNSGSCGHAAFFFLIELSFPQKSLSQRKVSQYGWTVTGLYLLEKKKVDL